jgi:hypothetical protein
LFWERMGADLRCPKFFFRRFHDFCGTSGQSLAFHFFRIIFSFSFSIPWVMRFSMLLVWTFTWSFFLWVLTCFPITYCTW